MKTSLRILSILLLASFFLSLSVTNAGAATSATVVKVCEMPVPQGHGTAGAFIGAIDDKTVIIAGGSDFPEGRPWEGGKKSFLDKIWILKKVESGFQCTEIEDTRLPWGLSGGCSAVCDRNMYCFGGYSEDGYSNKILRITLSLDKPLVEQAGFLPENFRASAAVLHKGLVYVHGTDSGKNALYCFNPLNGQWRSLSGCPDRILSEGSAFISQHNGKESALFLIGGRGEDTDGIHIAGNVWEYVPVYDKWTRRAEFTSDEEPIRLMYSSAISWGSAHIIIFGGDDGVGFLERLNLDKEISETTDAGQKAILKTRLDSAFIHHEGFRNEIFAYHTITDTWTRLADSELGLPVVTSAVKLGNDILIPSGEIHPGVRGTDIISVGLKDSARFGWLNYLVLILYLGGMLGIGFIFSRKNNNTEEFFKGGGSIPWWAAGISIFATALSAITFLSIPAKVYASDWKMFMYNMTIVMIVPIVLHFFLPYVKKLNVASIYQYLEERFSGSTRYLASAFFCLFMFARIAIVLFLPSLALNAVTGLNIYLCIILMGVVTIIYCTMGGIKAVVWGDVIQGFLLVGGAILSLVWILRGIDGGLGTMIDVAADNRKFNLLDFSFDFTQPVFWVAIIGGFSNQLLTYTSDQSVVQKYLTVKDIKGTKKGIWLNGILAIPVTFLFFVIGTGLYVFFKQHPDLLSTGMTNTDSIYPHYMMCQLPAGIAGLLIAAVFAAAMSTLASNINSSTTVMSEDFYAKFRKTCTDAQKVRFAKISGVVVGGLGVAMALALATFDIASLWDQFNFFLGLLTSGLGGLFMMGIFTKRIGTRAAFTGFAGSIVVLLCCSAFTEINSNIYGFIGLVSCFVTGYLASFVFGYRK